MTTVRTCLTTAAIAAAALAIGGCGASDEEQIREVAKEFVRLDTKKDAQRTCELLTARAEAQLTAFVGGGECVKAMRKLDSDEDRPSARELSKAKVRVRGDRALLAFGEQNIGLRKADGDWQVDNVLNASLDEQPRRFPAGLSAGSDARQVRATMTALAAAYADEDYERACALMSYGAEAQILFGVGFASITDTDAAAKPPSRLSCEWAHREIVRLLGDEGAFADEAPSAANIAAARVSIRGEHATVRVPGEKDLQRMIRQDGHWLVGPESEGITFEEADAPSPASLERCWRRAGARLATSAADLRFAVGGAAKAIAIKPGRVSVKGEGWRVFYTLPADGEDPGLKTVLAKPGSVRAVAYVKDAAAHPRTVARARACGS